MQIKKGKDNLDLPRLLVISHTSFTKSNSMGSTLASYLYGYGKDKLAQFFIKDMTPDIPICCNYYKVTDSEVFKKTLNPFIKPIGSIIKLDDAKDNKESDVKIKLTSGKKRYLGLNIRNFIWSIGWWNNGKLRAWIKDFSPQAILLQPGDFAYIFKIAIKISKRFNIPIIVHQSESYFLKNYLYHSLQYIIYRNHFQRAYKKLMKKTSGVIYLFDKLKENYDAFFSNVNSVSIMKATALTPLSDKREFDRDKAKFIYAGNLGLKRVDSLCEIGEALYSISKKYKLDVYGTTNNSEDENKLKGTKGIKYHGFLPYSEIVGLYKNADFIIHTESFDSDIVEDVKYGFTTKIADMFASGCIPIVYGDERISCVDYFLKNSLGQVITKKEQLTDKLKEIINDSKLQKFYLKNSKKQAKEYHDKEKNLEKTRRFIFDAFKGYIK